ncbi:MULTISPECIES: YSIRK signal domain/LPXTG anchor domain surface protein [Staphylococcus]|uniref:Gram-positive cocci surface proteins LPxTG domain-containing protein n=3 Tax=Staphylococcus haemolyticus TaxID=1283 RepID=Q4L6E4_STAHJ|nr:MULTISPECIES: YSIRK signal domain/LPXTG anchor domain surface protein [Staphylococcus]MBW5902740.1 YSIRK signal domain/LPXTG anchor domain surface protein [Staphylococcus haemolyticus]MCH4337669.1 YSIRK signal domain/LPXTG anchor domain surface protein [Staphylococcus haemolyticus]MCH4388099.1 YSIRK signal domain/LPXTG anchor domain surface protein [Staphylococcus haemolyticus]MCH4402312.1 YSIRK signal domain/LPXTG anchor domain surface protein [Staphylococcus haemolyticus]MCH4435066.1 YSIR
MNQHKKLQKFSIRKYAIGTVSTLVATFVFLGVNHDAQASEHLNPTQQHTNNNPENSINESSNTSIKPSDNKNTTGQVQSNQTSDTIREAKLIQQTNNKPQFNKDSSVSKQPSNTHVRKKRASNSDEIEFNRVVTGTVDNPSNAATTNSSLTPNDQQAPLIKPTFITSVGDAANTKRPIEILTSPNTDVALLDKDGATMGTGRTNETGHVTIIPQQWIPKGDVSAKATRGSESVTSDPVEALNTDPQHRPFVIEVTTDPFTRIELRDKYNKPLGASRTNDKGHAYIVPTRPIPEGNVTAVATDDSGNSSTSDPKKATDTTPPDKPIIHTNLVDKVGTLTPIEITTDPDTKVELFDKDNHLIGSGMTDHTGHITITPSKPLVEGTITAKATDDAETLNSSYSDPVNVTDLTPPILPNLETDLTGKAGTQTPITVTTDPNTTVELFDKDGNSLGKGTTDTDGHVTIIPNRPIPEGDVTAKATDNAEHPNSSTSQPKKATDTTPPIVPTFNTDIAGKAGTQTPITVTTDPNTTVELFDKDGNVIGSGITDGTGHAFITPTKPIPEGNVTVRATDDAEVPNSSTSDPVKATDTTPPNAPTFDTDISEKGGTLTPISVTTDPNTHVDIVDKDGNIIGSGTTDEQGHVTITPNVPIPEGNIFAKATDNAEHPNSTTSQPVNVIDTTPPMKPTVPRGLTGKANTQDPIEVITDPNTHIEIFDKDGQLIGTGDTDQNGHAFITPIKPIPEGNVTIKATDHAEHPNSSTSDPIEATDTTPPSVPKVNTGLNGKANTYTPVSVSTDPNTKVELLDKDFHVIGSGVTDEKGNAIITPTKPIPEGNVYVKATDNAARPNSSVSKPVKTTDTTPPPKPVVKGSMNGKAGTKDPIEIITEPYIKVEILDKDGHVIGSGKTDKNGHVIIKPNKPYPEGTIIIKATDNAQPPNSSFSDPIKVTDTTAPTEPKIHTTLIHKANTKTPVKVTTDPYTLVELLDKHGHVIGKATTDGNGNATIKPTTPIPEGEVTVRATDNAQHPNSSLSKPVKVTLADNDRAHKNGRRTNNTNQKDSKHNSGNTGDQGDNLSGYNQNDSNQNTVRSLPNTGYSNSESSTAFLMTSLLSGIALLSRKFKKEEK